VPYQDPQWDCDHSHKDGGKPGRHAKDRKHEEQRNQRNQSNQDGEPKVSRRIENLFKHRKCPFAANADLMTRPCCVDEKSGQSNITSMRSVNHEMQ
jgi:hypothetical protein